MKARERQPSADASADTPGGLDKSCPEQWLREISQGDTGNEGTFGIGEDFQESSVRGLLTQNSRWHLLNELCVQHCAKHIHTPQQLTCGPGMSDTSSSPFYR